MKILIIGATGTIGNYVAKHFNIEHDVIRANRNDTAHPVDIGDSKSIESLFEKIGQVDAIICAAGEAKWADFHQMSEDDFYVGIRSKLMGQVNLARLGLKFLNENGSITLTTGILADDPVVNTTSAAMVNGAIHSFVRALALEMPPTKRINAVSSGVVEDAYEKYQNFFPGHTPISMEKMTRAYVRSVIGKDNGQIIRVYD